MQVMLVNDTNIKQYVPDLPDEFFRLPYDSAKSDFIRASILYHQGGVYMDTDFLLMKPLTDVIKKLEEYDVVGYADNDAPSGDCGAHFSSNFLAARKGNEFSKTWWQNVKQKMTRTCDKGEFACEKVCCHARDAPTQDCHIPWAQLEILKYPPADYDRKVGGSDLDKSKSENKKWLDQNKTKCRDLNERTMADDQVSQDMPSTVKTFCMRKEQSMTPHLNGEVYWQPWDKDQKKSISMLSKDLKFPEKSYDPRFICTENAAGALVCPEGNWGKNQRTHDNFFGRTAYHLFFSTRRPSVTTKEEVLKGDFMVSEMYRRSLGLKA